MASPYPICRKIEISSGVRTAVAAAVFPSGPLIVYPDITQIAMVHSRIDRYGFAQSNYAIHFPDGLLI
jgi:hypothetical protein